MLNQIFGIVTDLFVEVNEADVRIVDAAISWFEIEKQRASAKEGLVVVFVLLRKTVVYLIQ